jgi:hypothetical protein
MSCENVFDSTRLEQSHIIIPEHRCKGSVDQLR